MTTTLSDDVRITGNLQAGGNLPEVARSDIAQEQLASYDVELTRFRVWDDLNANLPNAGASDDLGILGGTLGTNSPTLQTGDLKTAGATSRYARALVQLPPEYEAGQTVTMRIHAGMKTTISDGTATVDVECYLSDKEEGVGSDLCTTSATTINSVTLADKDFTISPGSLSPGDILDIRITVAINDTATGTAVIGMVGAVELLCDIRG